MRSGSPGRSRAGFTLIEVLMAVAVLGLVAAGALKLAALSERTLGEVAAQRRFLDQVRSVRIGVATGVLSERGESGDLSWEVRSRRKEDPKAPEGVQEWREAEIRTKDRRLTVCVP